MNFRKLSLLAMTTLLALSLPVSAQLQTFNLSFESAPVEQVTTYYGDLVGRSIIQNPTIKANISLKGRALSKDEVMQAIETVLEMNNVSLVPVGEKFLKVVASNSTRKEGAPLEVHSDGAEIRASDKVITRIITLKHADIQEAQNVLQQLSGRNGKIQPLERSGSLMITDSALNLKRMLEILEYIDQPAVKIEPRIYNLVYAEAGEVAQKLTELVEIAQSQSTTKAATAPARQTPAGIIRARTAATTQPAAVTSESASPLPGNEMIEGFVKITSDKRTNILIIFTKESNFEFFDKIIKVLDVPVEPEVLAEVVSLEYADAEEVSGILNSLVGSGGKSGSAKDRKTMESNETAAPEPKTGDNTQTQLGKLSDKVNVLADKRTNSILIMGSKSDIASLKSVISELDVMLAQVMIEAVILEVKLNDDTETGISWLQQNLDPSNGNIYDTIWNATSNILTNRPTDFLSSANTLKHYARINGIDMGVLINLAKTSSDVDILQTPVVLTTDNTEATITIGEERPIVTSTGTSTAGNDYSRYEYKSIGINLTVTPHINPQRFVIMDIEQSADEVGEDVTIDDNQVPTVLNREISASIAVQDRSTIALGGLVKTEERETINKIPLLGDIPLLGHLFKNTSKEKGRSELLVVLTPYVLTTPQEALATTRRIQKASAAGKIKWPEGWSESPLQKPTTDDEILDYLQKK